MQVTWPRNKKFAFTFCDDTDRATLQNVKPIYDFLESLGMRTTKLVWPLRGNGDSINLGDTCEDAIYADWLLKIQSKGFEMGLHNVSASSSTREVTERGLERFRSLFDAPPKIHANHTGCLENIYWGSSRVSGWRRRLYNYWTNGKNRDISRGHVEGDPLFWGDLCKDQITYVRNFTCDALNTLRFCPEMPYHDANKPYVNFWFACSNASSPQYFRKNFSIPLVDRLIDEGGLCIVYAHFGIGFYRNGEIDSHFREVIEHVASKEGWFAPVSEILGFLRNDEDTTVRTISPFRLQKLELKWFKDKYGKQPGI